MWTILIACEATQSAVRHAPPSPTSAPITTADETGGPASRSEPTDTAAAQEPCPAGMATVGPSLCIDRWEAFLEGQSPYEVPSEGVAVSALGSVPQGYISGDVAELACLAAGKRLCTSTEWQLACSGEAGRTYPYGDLYDGDACNDTRTQHPVVELFGADADWSTAQMNDSRLNQLPDSLAASGDFAACVTPEEVADLHGNLHEWVADAAGSFRGGFFVDAVLNGPGCSYVTTAHDRSYHDYSTGFRCCTDPTLP